MAGMKPSYLLKVGMIAVGLLFVLSLVLLFFSNTTTRTGSAITDPTRCPDCGQELPKSAQATGECPYCKLQQMAGKEVKRRGQGGSWATSPVVLVVLISLFVLLLGTHVFLLVRARRRGGLGEEPTYPLFCSKCHRKLRYRASQGGRLGQCPLCRRPLLFPKPPEPRKRPWPVRVWKQVMG
jgi:hypothetical protein